MAAASSGRLAFFAGSIFFPCSARFMIIVCASRAGGRGSTGALSTVQVGVHLVRLLTFSQVLDTNTMTFTLKSLSSPRTLLAAASAGGLVLFAG